jgi:hypothetical protein
LHRFIDSGGRSVDGCFSFSTRTHGIRQNALRLVILSFAKIERGLASELEGSRKRLLGAKTAKGG